MRPVAPAVRELARYLLAWEGQNSSDQGAMTNGTERACAKLRFHLVRLVGLEGFRALLSRALTLAKGEAPWLAGVEVRADGSLDGLLSKSTDPEAAGTLEGYVALLSQVLGLLVLFIGDELTMHLVREVWPEIPLSDGLLDRKEMTE